MIFTRPANITDCPSLAQVLISSGEHTFRGRVPDNCLDSLTLEESARNWAKNFAQNGNLNSDEHLLVATHESKVIGFILSATLSNQQKAELPILTSFVRKLRALSVSPSWQGKGIGRQLVSELATLVYAEGAMRLLVRCLKDNPNCAFYERLGAVKLGSLPYDWEGYQTEEILYGWFDLPSFIVGP